MKNFAATIFCFFVLLFTSCKKENAPDCLTPNGDDVSELRDLSEFRSIELNSDIEVTLLSGTLQKVEVIAGEYISDKINCSVTNGTLVIENLNKCNFVRGYKRKVRIKATLPYVTHILNNGVGDIIFDRDFKQDSTLNLNAGSSGDIYVKGSFDKIVTNSDGNGDLYFDGTANQLNAYSKGTNYTYAQNLDVRYYIFISTYSLGDTYLKLNSTTTLDYYIWKDGNIYYTGNPNSINELSDGTAKGKAIKED
jgi:hypothetical protein